MYTKSKTKKQEPEVQKKAPSKVELVDPKLKKKPEEKDPKAKGKRPETDSDDDDKGKKKKVPGKKGKGDDDSDDDDDKNKNKKKDSKQPPGKKGNKDDDDSDDDKKGKKKPAKKGGADTDSDDDDGNKGKKQRGKSVSKKGGKNGDNDSDDDDDQKGERGRSKKGLAVKTDKTNRARSQPSVHRIKSKKPEVKEPPAPKKPVNPYAHITEFYLGEYRAPICGANIFEMFEWKGQYAHLDINHAYFHWLFPHFQGVLGKEKAELFRSNAVIGKRIIDSYRLILDFYGLQLEDETTGVVSRSENGIARYKETFLRPYTNHEFRVKRMLQFLNVTGYRLYSIELVKFFEKEVFKSAKVLLPPLKSLELAFTMDWKPYGEVDPKDKKSLESLAHKCLFPYEILTQEQNSHLKILLS